MVKIKVRLRKLIETYRHQLLEFGAINPGDVDDALLQRWQEDQGANEALDALAQIVSRMEEIKKKAVNDVKPDFRIEIAAFLIPHILSASHVAKVEDQRSSDLVELHHKRRLEEKKVRSNLAKMARSDMPLPLLAACLEQVAAKLRHVHTTGHELPPIRVRSGKGPTRTRTLFIRDLSGWIHDLTDLWMDEQVAALAALILGGNIDADVVRNARRPTTRKARKSRHQQ